MVKEIIYKDKKWINAVNPTKEELDKLVGEYKIHQLIAEELSHPTLRPKVESFEYFLYLILHFPAFHEKAGVSTGAETDFVLGKDFMITVNYDTHTGLNEFFESLKKDSVRAEEILKDGIGKLLYSVLNFLYDFSLRQLDHIKLKIDAADDALASKDDEIIAQKIFYLRRDILNFRSSIKSHETVMASLEKYGTEFFGRDLEHHFRDISGEYYKLWHVLENHKETVDALYDTSVSYLSMRANEIMKRLTLMAFITFPLTLLAAIFSTKIAPDSLFGQPHDFILFIAVVSVAVISMLIFFKHRKWF